MKEKKPPYCKRILNNTKLPLTGQVSSPFRLSIVVRAYFNELLPLFDRIKGTANEILQMNQQNMHEANDRARRSAASG